MQPDIPPNDIQKLRIVKLACNVGNRVCEVLGKPDRFDESGLLNALGKPDKVWDDLYHVLVLERWNENLGVLRYAADALHNVPLFGAKDFKGFDMHYFNLCCGPAIANGVLKPEDIG